MVRITFLFFCFFSSILSWAKCGNSGITVWPEGSTLSQNPVIVVCGFSTSQTIIEQLGKEYKVYLRSEKDSIELLVQRLNKGQFDLTQVILKPKQLLIANTKYELVINGIKENEFNGRYNSTTGTWERVVWTVSDKKDDIAPTWIKAPTIKNKSYEMYGCGPERLVNFIFSYKDQSEVLIKVTLKSVKSGKKTTYYINCTNKEFSIGHGMCSGAFTFDDGQNYQVELALMDASGNETGYKGKPIQFTKPGNK